jgi:hypothetical protein
VAGCGSAPPTEPPRGGRPTDRDRGCITGNAFDPRVQRAIREVWGRQGRAAIQVAQCESGRKGTRARRAQYRGLFQMNAQARRKYGHGRCARQQARAAYRYFVTVGPGGVVADDRRGAAGRSRPRNR